MAGNVSTGSCMHRDAERAVDAAQQVVYQGSVHADNTKLGRWSVHSRQLAASLVCRQDGQYCGRT